MRLRYQAPGAIILLGTLASGALHAQSTAATAASPVDAPACTALTGSPQAVCQAAHDAVFAALPAWSLLITGGNPVLGTAGPSGRFGAVTLTVRANHALVVLPSTLYDGSTDTVKAARRNNITTPSVDLSFGIMQKAMPMGTVGVDFLSSLFVARPDATYLVGFPDDTRRLAGAVVGFGWGVRIGMQPNGPMPVASLSVTKRDYPNFTYGDLSSGSTYAYTLGISAIDVRLMLGKKFGGFEFSTGAGADLLKGTYSILFTDPVTHALAPQVDSTRSAMRIITATNAAFDLRPFRLTFEGGYQVGKDEKLPTIVKSVNPRSGRFFGGVGLGVKF